MIGRMTRKAMGRHHAPDEVLADLMSGALFFALFLGALHLPALVG